MIRKRFMALADNLPCLLIGNNVIIPILGSVNTLSSISPFASTVFQAFTTLDLLKGFISAWSFLFQSKVLMYLAADIIGH